MPTTITVEDSTLERFKQLKAELDEQQDAPDHTNESFLQALMDTWEAADDGYYSEPSADIIAKELEGEFLSEEQAKEIMECDNSEVLKRIDDLESQLPKQVAREVRNG